VSEEKEQADHKRESRRGLLERIGTSGAFLTLFYFAVSQGHSGTRGMICIALAAIVLKIRACTTFPLSMPFHMKGIRHSIEEDVA
jgi:hypothetical protein